MHLRRFCWKWPSKDTLHDTTCKYCFLWTFSQFYLACVNVLHVCYSETSEQHFWWEEFGPYTAQTVMEALWWE